MSTPIKQLQNHQDGTKFYPYTHKNAVIGLQAELNKKTEAEDVDTEEALGEEDEYLTTNWMQENGYYCAWNNE